ncbi:GDSL-type esterase/lipase family protein, partial [Streptomyces sp. NPDC048845]
MRVSPRRTPGEIAARAGRARRRPRTRGAVAVLAAAAALLTAVTGCEDGAGSDDAARDPSRSPSPSPLWDTSPDSLAAVGDSITRGFDACSVLADCPEVSWATGTGDGMRSLARRLLDDPAGSSWNHARSGATMADLPAQMARAVRHRPELVTVMVGGNDACRDTVALMTPAEEFRAGFRTALKTLREALPKTQVYVASVPDLHRLWSEGRKNPVGKQIWKLGICQSMLGDP